MRPVRLGPNQPPSFYRSSRAISVFRGVPGGPGEDLQPEDWIASTTAQFGRSPSGLTRLPDGELLVDAVAADPTAWLGAEHIERYGAEPRLLVKLLDAGQRLPVHVHPDRDFAANHLTGPYGKTEAWLIVDAGADAFVHLGFTHDVESGQLAAWCRDQQTEALLAATNRVPVAAGDSVFVPAGLPHAIGPGILLVELQEPTDFSIFLEWKGFDLDGAAEGHLGLGYDLALQCVDRAALGADRLTELQSSRDSLAFPAQAEPFFRAERIYPRPTASLDPGYSVLVVLAGSGELTWDDGTEPLRRGDTILLPYATGPAEVSGADLALVRARPSA